MSEERLEELYIQLFNGNLTLGGKRTLKHYIEQLQQENKELKNKIKKMIIFSWGTDMLIEENRILFEIAYNKKIYSIDDLQKEYEKLKGSDTNEKEN